MQIIGTILIILGGVLLLAFYVFTVIFIIKSVICEREERISKQKH